MHAQATKKPQTPTSLLSSSMPTDPPDQRTERLEPLGLTKVLQENGSTTVLTPVTKELRRQPKKRSEGHDQMVWSGRLRPRSEHKCYSAKNAGPLHSRKAAMESLLPRPASVTKHNRASRAKRPSAAKHLISTCTPPKLDSPSLHEEQPMQQDSPPQTSSDSGTTSEWTTRRSLRSPSRNGKTLTTMGVRGSRISK